MNNTEENNNDMATCGGACSYKDRKKNKNLKGDNFKSIGSFHTDPIIELILKEKELLKNESIENQINQFKEKDPSENLLNNFEKSLITENTQKNYSIENLSNINLENSNELKKLFMQDPETIYLNHGAFGSPFLESYNYAEEIRRKVELNPVKFFDRDLFPYLAKTIVKIANLLNCDPLNLMPLGNATSGLNAIFRSLSQQLKKVVCFDITYSATPLIIEELLPLEFNKPEIINIPLKYLKSEKIDDLINYIRESIPLDADMVVLDHISSQSAILFPIKELIESIRNKFSSVNKEIIILIDGAHAPGSIKVNIDELKADFYVGNLHKWLCSPRGGGFIYINQKHIAKIKGAIVSHGHGNKNNLMDSFYWDGNRDYSGFISALKTFDIWEVLEKKNVYEFLKNKLKICAEYICQKLNVKTLFSIDLYNSTMVFLPLSTKFQQFTAKTIQDWLHFEHKIEITIKNVYEKNCMRLSVHLYNSIEDIEKLVSILLEKDIKLDI